ncbi:MAG: VanZ family protein [Erysipelotrichaceae bacterium]|nr:VanZ family protein [Erysipelotrichaceae bacterium]
MQFSSFFSLAFQCLIVAFIIVIIIASLYAYIHKHVLKKNTLSKRQSLKYILLAVYLIVVFIATLFSRESSSYGVSLQLLSSYRYAWNNFSISEWRYIILNILMFLPIGFLVPLVFVKMRAFYKTTLFSLVFTLLIETSQLVSHRGIFEADDILNNLLGGMIGYGLFTLFHYLYSHVIKVDKKPKWKIILAQLPLVLTFVVFTSIFVIYHQQELGNLKENYNQIIDMSDVSLSLLNELDEEKSNDYIYTICTFNQEECNDIVQTIFDNLNLTIDTIEKGEDAYIYTSSDNHIITINSDGTYQYGTLSDENSSNLTSSNIKALLKRIGIEIPDDVTITQEENMYSVFIDMESKGDYILNGTIDIQINDNHITYINYNTVIFDTYKEVPIISPNEAYQMINDGYFITDYINYLPNDMDIKYLGIRYHEDSKGYYQPVYTFQVLDDNEVIGAIYIPAMK